MEEVVIVSYARSAMGKSFRGGFNATHGAVLAAPVIREVVNRSLIEEDRVDDVILGCGFPEGATGFNIARQSALAAGLPEGVAAMTVNRFCSSGLEAIAIGAQRILAGEAEVVVAGGVESISCVQRHTNAYMSEEGALKRRVPAIYWPMLQTAEEVARRYGVDKASQDAFGVRSQQLAAAAQARGVFREEIVPVLTEMMLFDPETKKEAGSRRITVDTDEGIRSSTTLEVVAGIRPALDGGVVTAGNSSQFSDGAAAVVLMRARRAEKLGLEPLGRYRGYAVAGCAPDIMGIGPVHAVPKLLARTCLRVDDIDLWELNEAFAVQVLHCADTLGIPTERLNVNGGAIALGHPYGVSGARLVGSGLREARRRRSKYLVSTMCVAGGMGAAALFEAC
ncbi:MAG: acetyl-CoA C-acyltransferase [Burkholderiaceae bacterium]